jgi:hypothetical protein
MLREATSVRSVCRSTGAVESRRFDRHVYYVTDVPGRAGAPTYAILHSLP